MISKLERRFTIVAIVVITSVLIVLLTAVNMISVNRNISRADSVLNRLSLPIEERFEPENNNPELPPLEKDQDRAFDIIADSEGQVIIVNTPNKIPNTTIDAQDLIDQVLAQSSKNGFVEDFRYLQVDHEDTTQIYFLDYSFEKRAETSFLWGSIIMFFVAIVLVALLVRIFLKPVMKPIKEAYEKQKRFITDASHEIRTPLTIISTNIQLMEMESGTTEWTDSIQKQVKRLENLSEGLVTLSRLDETNIPMVQQKINLSNILNDVIMGFEPAIYADKKTLETTIQDDVMVMGNNDGLEKVLSTLMHNALKYTSKDGVIEVILTSDHKRIKVAINNTATGLEKGVYDAYFERFYRAEASRNSETGGFGIGLAIAKSIVEEHHGSIEALSKDGQQFSINIRLKPFK